MFTLSTLITLILVLVVIGFVLYLIDTRLPIDPTIKTIIYFLVIMAVVIWLLNSFGLLHGVHL